MGIAYRHTLDGNGPYQSEEFDTEAEAVKAAEERGHVVTAVLSLNADGTATPAVREQINVQGFDQNHTDGQQPA